MSAEWCFQIVHKVISSDNAKIGNGKMFPEKFSDFKIGSDGKELANDDIRIISVNVTY